MFRIIQSKHIMYQPFQNHATSTKSNNKTQKQTCFMMQQCNEVGDSSLKDNVSRAKNLIEKHNKWSGAPPTEEEKR